MKRAVTTTMTVFISKGLYVLARTTYLKKHSAIKKSKISQVSTTRMGFTS
jgi:hypothetical protein